MSSSDVNPTPLSVTDNVSQQQQQQNRYAHLVTSSGSSNKVHTIALNKIPGKPVSLREAAGIDLNGSDGGSRRALANGRTPQQQAHDGTCPSSGTDASKAQNKNYYYQSFSSVDLREQWQLFKEKTLEQVEEPACQRKLIMLIVCTALLLDNMLYMVIVPIIPDYLRRIGSWATYTENAQWVRVRNSTRGAGKWERVGGQVVYEGEDSAVGFLFASKAIVQLIANPFSGAIADRIGYEIPMMFGLIVMFLSTMVFACGQTYSVLFLARSLQGVGSAFADTPGIALLADRFTEEKERRRAQGIAIAFISFGCLVAPPFGSVLYQGAGKEVPFILLSLVCLIDGSLLLLVCPPGTFSQIWPKYYAAGASGPPAAPVGRRQEAGPDSCGDSESAALKRDDARAHTGNYAKDEDKQRHASLRRQKSISRRHSMTLSAGGEAPKGTPIEVLLKDRCIACCAGALVVANVSLAFLEPTISIWVKNTMPDVEEWQEGMIWLPAFFPHLLGVLATLHFAEKYPHSTWKIAASGLLIEGLGCLVVPFCGSLWSLVLPISIICFGVALIDTAILPTLGFLVDTRFTSVYGNVYAIADISYSVSYAIGPIIAGGIVEAIGFTALSFLIAMLTLAYTPTLMMLRSIRDYEPFEADATGRLQERMKPFGQFGRPPLELKRDAAADTDEETEAEAEAGADYDRAAGSALRTKQDSTPTSTTPTSATPPAWSSGSSFRKSREGGQARSPKSVKIVESPTSSTRNPFR